MRGYVDESIDIIFGHGFYDSLRAFAMYVLKCEILCWVIPTNKIVYDIRMADALFN